MANIRAQSGYIKVLFVTADPTASLMLDEEIREITQKIRASEHRDALDITYTLATRPDDLLQSLNQHKPHIVHFSGHGSRAKEILLLDDNRQTKPVSAAALKALFTTLKDNIRVVFLNACYSQTQAKAITSSVDCTIGMSREISDQAAITFAASFYRAIGFNRSLQEAFDQGKVALQLAGIPEHITPSLLTKEGFNPAHIRLLDVIAKSAAHNNKTQLNLIQSALLNNDYRSAYRDIDRLVRSAYDNLSSVEQAKLKYLEALVHLQGIRPYSQSPAVIQTTEGLMCMAHSLHPIFFYPAALAIFKYDFARAGLRSYRAEADRLMGDARKLASLTVEDHENINLFSQAQPDLYKDYRYHFSW